MLRNLSYVLRVIGSYRRVQAESDMAGFLSQGEPSVRSKAEGWREQGDEAGVGRGEPSAQPLACGQLP